VLPFITIITTGCFDLEEEAARAYDKMMLWCELHNTAGVKGGITNYDASEYEKDLGWLQTVSQVRWSPCCLTLLYDDGLAWNQVDPDVQV
jgi:hypothetical protein